MRCISLRCRCADLVYDSTVEPSPFISDPCKIIWLPLPKKLVHYLLEDWQSIHDRNQVCELTSWEEIGFDECLVEFWCNQCGLINIAVFNSFRHSWFNCRLQCQLLRFSNGSIDQQSKGFFFCQQVLFFYNSHFSSLLNPFFLSSFLSLFLFLFLFLMTDCH
jgi:hypothetical protein